MCLSCMWFSVVLITSRCSRNHLTVHL